MNFYDVIEKRRSIRGGYKPDAVPDDVLKRIANAVAEAPTACNRQPIRILVIRNREILNKICAVYQPKWLKDAPAIAIVLGNEKEAWTRFEGDSIINVDCAIAMEHFILAATAEGLSTCWICAFERKAMNSAVGAEAPWNVMAISPLGYSDLKANVNISKKTTDLFKVID